jgi:protein-L-isoaspartate(D-aspartate) O-methyltransferase
VVRGQSPVQQATLLTELDAATPHVVTLFETDLPYLRHAAPVAEFVF